MTLNEYIRKMYSILVPMCTTFGYHNVAAAMIAQSIQEGWNSKLATMYHNYWGMKAGESYKGKTVVMDNKQKNDKATYRAFSSMEAGCDGYFVFLSYPRYKSLRNCTTDSEYLDKIGPCGWNGNPGYGARCKTHLKTVYAALGQADATPTSQWKIGKTYTTQQDLNIRKEPNGAPVPYIDLTADAKKHSFVSNGGAVLKSGTRVTVKEIKSTGSATWLRIPSGWICGKNSKSTYVI